VLFGALSTAPRERVAIGFPGTELTYGELDAATLALAGELAGQTRVAVIAEPRIETCVAVVAALRAGVPAIPLNPRSGTSELAHIVADADPGTVLAANGTVVPERLAGRRVVVIDLPALAAGGTTAHPDGAAAVDASAPDAPALIVYTSGTTGAPKGAVLPHRAVASNLDALASAWAWSERDVVCHGLPLFHVHGLVIGILGPLRRGGGALHLGRFSPDGVQRALEGPATMLFGVPTMYRRLADAAETSPGLAAALRRARLLVSGSAALPATEHRRLRALTGRPVLERYGMTETLMNTAQRVEDPDPPAGTVGIPVDGVQLRLIDDHGVPIEARDDETIGEIQVRGENLFLGYLNRPDATAAAIRDGWFSTGDMATRAADGAIRIVGRRATDLIKSGGYKIGAGEIETCLRDHAAVADAAVTGEPDEDMGERVVAWVVLRDGAAASEQELAEHVTAALAPHKRPRVVRFLDELPRNELGKVQKLRLAPPG
jgi:malonyl-CoA/methylmalonyl-CoA synthetase